jgi:hypothetical protein
MSNPPTPDLVLQFNIILLIGARWSYCADQWDEAVYLLNYQV